MAALILCRIIADSWPSLITSRLIDIKSYFDSSKNYAFGKKIDSELFLSSKQTHWSDHFKLGAHIRLHDVHTC